MLVRCSKFGRLGKSLLLLSWLQEAYDSVVSTSCVSTARGGKARRYQEAEQQREAPLTTNLVAALNPLIAAGSDRWSFRLAICTAEEQVD